MTEITSVTATESQTPTYKKVRLAAGLPGTCTYCLNGNCTDPSETQPSNSAGEWKTTTNCDNIWKIKFIADSRLREATAFTEAKN